MSRPKKAYLPQLELLETRIQFHGDVDPGDGNVQQGTIEDLDIENARLPDLILWDDDLLGFNHLAYLDSHPETGRKIMRFSTAVPNVGDGPLWVRGAEAVGDQQDVYQVIVMEDDSIYEKLAGQFVYHAEHNHIHLDEYAEYNLREITPEGGVGEKVAAGEKISFCLWDFATYDLQIPDAPEFWKFTDCNRQTQGISVGWADIYAADIYDQWIDIEDVPPGEYWFETVIDPFDNLLESNEFNNTMITRVVLGVPEFAPDSLEGRATDAQGLVYLGDQQLNGLSIHRPGDIDTFKWQATNSGTVTVDLSFDHALGDIDLYAWTAEDGIRVEMGRGVAESDTESISVEVQAGQNYYFVVKDLMGWTNPEYSLTIDGPDLDPDSFEANDDFSSATPIDSDEANFIDLSIHEMADRDYFTWTAPRDGRLYLDARTRLGESFAEILVFDADHQSVYQSDRQQQLSSTTFDVLAGEQFYFQLKPELDRRIADYEFRLNFLEIEADAFEPNDIFGEATELDLITDSVIGTLHLPTDHDYLLWTAPATGEATVRLEIFGSPQKQMQFRWWEDGEFVGGNTVDGLFESSNSVVEGKKYYFEVFSPLQQTVSEYRLTINGPTAPVVTELSWGRSATEIEIAAAALGESNRVPFDDIDRVTVMFDRDVIVAQEDLQLHNGSDESIEVTDFQYSPEDYSATWLFDSLVAGQYAMTLNDSVTDALGNALDADGDWQNGLPLGDRLPGGSLALALEVQPGDINQDGVTDVADVNLICSAMDSDLMFDLTADGFVNRDDHTYLLENILGSGAGDANLDGVFDSTDLIIVFQAGQYEDDLEANSRWSDGDWNCDGEFDSADLVFVFKQDRYSAAAVDGSYRTDLIDQVFALMTKTSERSRRAFQS